MGDYAFSAHADHEMEKDEITGNDIMIWKDVNSLSDRIKNMK
jgi:hypothetical protein